MNLGYDDSLAYYFVALRNWRFDLSLPALLQIDAKLELSDL